MDALHRRLVQRIKYLAADKQVPVTHLPDLAGVSRSHFWDVLAGRKSPTLEWLSKLAKALGVDVATLLTPGASGSREK